MEWVPNIYIESVKITPLVLQSAVEINILINSSSSDIHKEDNNSSGDTSDSVTSGNVENIEFQIDVYAKGTLIKSENQ
jgi:hypothetical protein